MSKKQKIILVILGLAGITFFFNQLWFNQVKNGFFAVFTPASKLFWQSGQRLSAFASNFFSGQQVVQENDNLKQQNLFLLGKITKLQYVQQENENFRKALDLGLEKKYQLASADIISQTGDGEHLLLRGGEDKGISKDMAVISFEGALLGKVEKVFPDFAQVILITAKDFSFEVEIQKQEQEPILGMAKGMGGANLEMQLVPQDKTIQDGDVVVSASLGNYFPKGLVVGKISEIKKSDSQPFQTAKIEPYFNDFKLGLVLVIKSIKINQ